MLDPTPPFPQKSQALYTRIVYKMVRWLFFSITWLQFYSELVDRFLGWDEQEFDDAVEMVEVWAQESVS